MAHGYVKAETAAVPLYLLFLVSFACWSRSNVRLSYAGVMWGVTKCTRDAGMCYLRADMLDMTHPQVKSQAQCSGHVCMCQHKPTVLKMTYPQFVSPQASMPVPDVRMGQRP